MKISIGSSCYAGGCLVLGVLNAYQNPVQWITTFALGVLAGLSAGHLMAGDVLKDQNTIDAVRNAKDQKGLESAQEAVKAGADPVRAVGKLLSAQASTVEELKASLNRTSPEDKRNDALRALIHMAIPGEGMTIINLLDGAINWMPRIDTCATFYKWIIPEFKELEPEFKQLGVMANIISSFALGFQVGSSIQLGRLWFNQNHGLQQKLKPVVL